MKRPRVLLLALAVGPLVAAGVVPVDAHGSSDPARAVRQAVPGVRIRGGRVTREAIRRNRGHRLRARAAAPGVEPNEVAARFLTRDRDTGDGGLRAERRLLLGLPLNQHWTVMGAGSTSGRRSACRSRSSSTRPSLVLRLGRRTRRSRARLRSGTPCRPRISQLAYAGTTIERCATIPGIPLGQYPCNGQGRFSPTGTT